MHDTTSCPYNKGTRQKKKNVENSPPMTEIVENFPKKTKLKKP